MSEPDLFDAPDPPWSRSGTSEDAAKSVRESAANIRNRILRLTAERGLQGLTCYEAERIFNLSENGCHPRFWELATLSHSPAARKIRLTVPRQLFVVDKTVAERAVARPSGKSGRNQLVYFAFQAVSLDEVLRHYGLKREE